MGRCISHQCLLWEKVGVDWGSSFAQGSWHWDSGNVCVVRAPLSALLTGFPLSYPALQLGAASAVKNTLRFLVQMAQLLLQQQSLLSCYRSASKNQPGRACKTTLSSHSPFFGGWGVWVPHPSVFKRAQGLVHATGEIQPWMPGALAVFPLRHPLMLTVPQQMPRTSIPSVLQLCPACCGPQRAAQSKQGQNTAHRCTWIGKSCPVTKQGAIPAAVTRSWAVRLDRAPTLVSGTVNWMELMF